MKLDGINYEKEKIIKTFNEAGVDDEYFFSRIITTKKIIYARYESRSDFYVWTSENLNQTISGLEAFDSYIAEKDYVELRYNQTNEIYVEEI